MWLGRALRGFSELWGAVKTGIDIGRAMENDDVATSFQGLILSAHDASWSSIINGGTLNAGQQAMAYMCQDAGAEYLANVFIMDDFDPGSYGGEMEMAAENAGEALSDSIARVTAAVTNVTASSAAGIYRYIKPEIIL